MTARAETQTPTTSCATTGSARLRSSILVFRRLMRSRAAH
jgi:hypothetical protein